MFHPLSRFLTVPCNLWLTTFLDIVILVSCEKLVECLKAFQKPVKISYKTSDSFFLLKYKYSILQNNLQCLKTKHDIYYAIRGSSIYLFFMFRFNTPVFHNWWRNGSDIINSRSPYIRLKSLSSWVEGSEVLFLTLKENRFILFF